jgi:hypothetical protein
MRLYKGAAFSPHRNGPPWRRRRGLMQRHCGAANKETILYVAALYSIKAASSSSRAQEGRLQTGRLCICRCSPCAAQAKCAFIS